MAAFAEVESDMAAMILRFRFWIRCEGKASLAIRFPNVGSAARRFEFAFRTSPMVFRCACYVCKTRCEKANQIVLVVFYLVVLIDVFSEIQAEPKREVCENLFGVFTSRQIHFI